MGTVRLVIEDITDNNRNEKFQKGIKTLSKQLGIPATIEHKEHNKEEFPFKAQEELYEMYKTRFGLQMDDLYSKVSSTLGMNPVSTFRKSIDPNAPKLGKEILWNPETGTPITQKELDRLLNAVDKFMNRNDPTKEFVINQAAVARIIANLREKSTLEEVRKKELDTLKFKDKKWDSFSSYKDLNDYFPDNYDRLKFRERVVGNYIQDIGDKTRTGIRDVLDQGFLAGKSKGEISQELFDQFGSLNKNWDRIVDTEGVNIFNSEYIDEQKRDVQPGEELYFIRREYGDAKTCSFCIQAVNEPIIAKWSETPLSDENIKDPYASIALWSGKTNFSRPRSDWWWAESGIHPNCYSDDTEVLTDSGWKLFKEVLPLDKIMSINPKTKEIDYLNHKGLVSYHHDGDMIFFDGLNYDLLVTPDHNCLYYARKSGSLMEIKAKDMLDRDLALPRGIAEWYGFDYEISSLAKESNLSVLTYAKLWGWFLSEGNVRFDEYNGRKRHEIKLSQKNPQDIVDDLGEDPRFKIAKDAIYIFDKNITDQFRDYWKVYAEKKHIPKFIKNATVPIIKEFLESFRKGDGSYTEKKPSRLEYGKMSKQEILRTSSPIMMAELCELIVKSGKFCSVLKQDGKGIPVTHRNGTYIGNTDCYNISVLTSKCRNYYKGENISQATGLSTKKIQKIEYSGMVYDVELIKWHYLLVKRNGKLAWSGNCRGTWDKYYEEIGDIEL